MSKLEVKDLTYYYQDGNKRRVLLNQINASFETGYFYTIVGESGSGKTTFLSLIAALDDPKEGKVLYEGKDIREIGYDKYRRDNMAIVFQNYNLIPYLTAAENVWVAMGITDNPIPSKGKEAAYPLLENVGIDTETANRKASNLSGGEQQRTAIARALSTGVDVIMADEPTGNLDPETGASIIRLFSDLAHKQNRCVIVVTHDHKAAEQSDVILRLDPAIHKLIVEKGQETFAVLPS